MRSSRLCVIIIQGIGTDRIECHGLARKLCLLVFLIVRLPFFKEGCTLLLLLSSRKHGQAGDSLFGFGV